MESVFSQIGPWLFFLTLGSGMGIPLGIPPAPDDPVMARFGPRSASSTPPGRQTPRQGHKQEQAEQMLAEPEVRQLLEHIEKWIRHSVNQPGGEGERKLSDATFDWNAHDPPPSDDDLRVGPEDQEYESFGQGRHARRLGARHAGGHPALPPKSGLLPQPQREIGGRRPPSTAGNGLWEAQGQVPHADRGNQGFLLDCGRGRGDFRPDPRANAKTCPFMAGECPADGDLRFAQRVGPTSISSACARWARRAWIRTGSWWIELLGLA